MLPSLTRWLVPALLSTTAAAQAPPAPHAPRPDPLDARASVPSRVHQSAFTGYRRFGDEKPIPWREANDTVTRIGGWRFYAREAQQPDPAPAAKPLPVPVPPLAAEPVRPTPPGHDGHLAPAPGAAR